MDTKSTNDQAVSLEKIKIYIQRQLQAGLQPNEVAQQLRLAGWGNDMIKRAFELVQTQVMPSSFTQNNLGGNIASNGTTITGSISEPQSYQDVPRRGRIKTGWLLFKQSWRVLRSDKMLIRYVIMSAVYSLLLVVIYALVILFGRSTFLTTATSAAPGTRNYSLTPLGYIPTFIFYVLTYFVVNLYAAGLAANVLDLFHGKKEAYGYYMEKARSRAGSLFVFSLIEATAGLVLRAITERSRLLGRIVVWALGAVWSLARLFVVPIIVSSDEGAVEAIKDSTKLLISTWGENLTGRVSMNGVLFLFYLLIIIPLSIVAILLGAIGGPVGIIISLALIVLSILAFSIIASAVSSVLNTALFYYAKNRQVPGAFDASLLNSVFIKKKRGLLRRKDILDQA